MPKGKNPKLAIHLDLLHPQSSPEKVFVKLIRWLLSTGRYLFIFVEAVVLVAFITRFKLDADLADTTESIEQQIPYIESLKPFEVLIRQTQFKLATVDSFYATYADFGQILKKIADQTPSRVRLSSLNFEKGVGQISINLSGSAQSNSDLNTFLGGLRQDSTFSEVTITSIGLERGIVSFSLSAQARLTAPGASL